MYSTNWTKVRLGNMVTLVNGRGFKSTEWSDQGLPIIRISNLNGDSQYNFYQGEYEPKHLISNDDLLFSWSGNRGTSFGPYIWKGQQGLLNQHIFKVIPNDNNNKQYLYQLLRHLTSDIEKKAHGGSGLVHVKKSDLENYEIYLPSFEEQQRIADILSSIDDVIEITKAIINQTETVKKGLMQQLLTKGIGHTEFKDTEIGKIPTSWVTMEIQDCCEILDSKRVPLSKEVREGKKGPYPYYGATGIVDTINDYIFDHDIVLIGEDGDHFKKYKDWSMTNLVRGKSWVNNHAHVLNAKEYLTINDWIFRYFEHRDLFPYLSIQGATRLKLTQQNLKKIPIALPPIEEQKKICEIINSVVVKLESERKALAKYQSLKKGLMNILLAGEIRVNTKQLDEVLV